MAGTVAHQLGSLIVLSGPSGAGKTSVYRAVLARHPEVRFSVSCTTRAPRPTETADIDYHFLSAPVFRARAAAGEFLEYAEVHGNWYGTLRAEVEGPVQAGTDILLDIDVQGARQVRAALRGTPLAATTVFVFCAPPSLAELERRLRDRQTDSDAVIARRVAGARAELAAWREYDWLVVNERDRLAAAAAQLEAILIASRCRTAAYPKEPWSL